MPQSTMTLKALTCPVPHLNSLCQMPQGTNQARHALINGSPPSTTGTTKATILTAQNQQKRSVSNHPLLKEGGWLNHIGSSVSLCARATRAILNHAPIGGFRKGFFPQSNHACPCSHRRVKTRAHILNDCSRFIYKNIDRMVIKHFVLFLTDSPRAFAQSSNIT